MQMMRRLGFLYLERQMQTIIDGDAAQVGFKRGFWRVDVGLVSGIHLVMLWGSWKE